MDLGTISLAPLVLVAAIAAPVAGAGAAPRPAIAVVGVEILSDLIGALPFGASSRRSEARSESVQSGTFPPCTNLRPVSTSTS